MVEPAPDTAPAPEPDIARSAVSHAVADAGDPSRQIEWCLLSHTNIGKTSLTRTLLADDVGEIQDAAHVTSQSQRYLLQGDAHGDQLWLWDTPGFGDSVRLYERLKQQGNPLGWFLSNVWDRWRDKPFYMSQRALVAARDHADVMLYLVNAAEDPADAGYWESEMRILQWMNKPVIILLNQIGSDTTQEQTAADLQRWREAVQPFSGTVHDVLVLDAFTRSWWHERTMLQSIAPLLPPGKLPAYERLLAERERRQQAREEASLRALAEQLVACARAQEAPQQEKSGLWGRAVHTISQKLRPAQEDVSPEMREAMKRLFSTLQQADVRSTQQLLQLHQLDGDAASRIQQQLKSDLSISRPNDPQAAGLWGAHRGRGNRTGRGSGGRRHDAGGRCAGRRPGGRRHFRGRSLGREQDARPGVAALAAVGRLSERTGVAGLAQVRGDLAFRPGARALQRALGACAVERGGAGRHGASSGRVACVVGCDSCRPGGGGGGTWRRHR